jgi:hypothetical protein
MKLPNADRAVVGVEKLRDYCLNPDHGEGEHKARVFHSALGYTQANAESLRQMILTEVPAAEARTRSATQFGARYVVDFEVEGLSGPVTIRTAWIVRHGEDVPRLTSCYIL